MGGGGGRSHGGRRREVRAAAGGRHLRQAEVEWWAAGTCGRWAASIGGEVEWWATLVANEGSSGKVADEGIAREVAGEGSSGGRPARCIWEKVRKGKEKKKKGK
jgi:hypothetical protein